MVKKRNELEIAVIRKRAKGRIAARLAQEMPGAEIFVHEKVKPLKDASSFGSIVALTKQAFLMRD
jgi:hypothetical protein